MTIPTFDTSYIGAHRWHIEDRRGFDWTCVCGDHGRVVTSGSDPVHAVAYVVEAFGRHAHEKLQEAAVSLLGEAEKLTGMDVLQADVNLTREHGDHDEANLLQLVFNRRYEREGK